MKNTNNINYLRKKVGLSLLALLGQQVVAVPVATWLSTHATGKKS